MTAPVQGWPPQPPGTARADNAKKVSENAGWLVTALYTDGNDRSTLVFHRGEFYAYTGTYYRIVAPETLRAQVWSYFSHAVFPGQIGTGNNQQNVWMPFDPNPEKVSAIIDALKSVALIDREVDVPAWLDASEPIAMDKDSQPCDPHEIMVVGNGLLHASTGRLWQHSAQFYNHNAVDYAFDPAAPKPEAWLTFLQSLWPEDQETIDCLQEIVGYLITHRTDMQKLFLFYGAKRGGKGTIIRIITELLGHKNVSAPSMSDLNDPSFGLASLERASLAVMSDLRFDKRQDGTATERLLKITGEDEVLVNKKYKDPYTAKLSCRFLIASNLLPKLKDESGALSSRFILLKFTQSFYGRENRNLTKIMLAELPGILNWALAGLKRLNARGHFVQPSSGLPDIADMTDQASPHIAFVREVMDLGDECVMAYGDAWELWKQWCKENGHTAGSKQRFLNDLKGAHGHIRDVKRGKRGEQTRCLAGITPNAEGQLVLARAQWVSMASEQSYQRF